VVESTEIARQQIAAFNVTSPVGAPLVEELIGQYRGEAVVPSSEASKLTEAAEEIGMSVAHRFDKKALGQRKVREDAGISAEALAHLKDFHEKLPDMPSEAKLLELAQRLRDYLEQSGGLRDSDVLAELQAFDADVTHQFAAIEVLESAFADEPGMAQALAAARTSFERADVLRDVRAGFAAAEAAHRAAATLETDPAAVRNAYRAMIREAADFARVFEALQGFDLLKSLPEAIATFMEAAGRDLAAAGPSIDPAQLADLLKELGKLKKVQTTLAEADGMLKTTARLVGPDERALLDGAVALTGRLLGFAAKAVVAPADAIALLGALAQGSASSQVALANGIRNLHADLADEVLPGHGARLQQAATLVDMVEDISRREEAEFAKGRSG
jgi:type III secretion system YopN/LcrE/InvE/MxiC family regulator